MSKMVSVTARLETGMLEYVEKVSKMLNIDKSTTFRNLVRKGIDEDRKEKAIDLYLRGKLTIEGAADFADAYVGEFLELMKEKGVESNATLEDFRKSLQHAKALKK